MHLVVRHNPFSGLELDLLAKGYSLDLFTLSPRDLTTFVSYIIYVNIRNVYNVYLSTLYIFQKSVLEAQKELKDF